ncbi:MAG: hypothetical protein A2173_05810 [Planctomycetes bacterium RBG_13_44_8b]|nr:MAG: hypothetical protein A2173_05810 [Planctomycetes bacterium RBG_13_44_8b]
MNGGTTGGAGGTIITVDNAADFKTYTEASEPYIIHVSGLIDLAPVGGLVNISSDKTIRGIDASPTIIGKLAFVSGSSNIIIKELTITNPDYSSEYDGISVKDDITNLFITRCTIYDCGDGCLDITNRSDYITVSWCKFYYNDPAPNENHRFVNLIGSTDDPNSGDRGKLRVTMHHNWWSVHCNQRMPRVRFGQVHLYNNYYACTEDSACVCVGNECQIRLENNCFDDISRAWRDYYSGSGIRGKIGWNGNVFINTSIPTWAPNDYATIFTPPYSYTLDTGSDVKDIVRAYAGAGACYGDFIDLGTLNMEDLEYFITEYWLVSDSNKINKADYNYDGIINFYEFTMLAKNWMYISPDITPPASPTGLWSTGGDGTVSLNWYNNSEADLAGYNIYRSTTNSSGYTVLNGALVTSSDYTDNTVINGTAYWYVVTAVDISDNESDYSNEVWAIPLGAGSIVIQEDPDPNYTNGFCGGDGTIYTTYAGYTGDGYYRTALVAGKGINWSISALSSGTYTFKWRYAFASGDRPARLLINDSEVVSHIDFPATGTWTNWLTVSQEVSLTAGVNNIRLESTGGGLAHIDYIMITGDSPEPASCP